MVNLYLLKAVSKECTLHQKKKIKNIHLYHNTLDTTPEGNQQRELVCFFHPRLGGGEIKINDK